MLSQNDTIAAISTPLGEGALAIIRLSGPQALRVADASVELVGANAGKPSTVPTHTLHYGRVVRQDRVVDEVLLGVMRAPRTYTRQDVVEISCHGGLLSARLVLEAVLAQGARLAEPGEFTQRAFLNGRLDLAQAEAVADVIHSRTELALAAAQQQLAGALSRHINELRDDLVDTLAHIEAHIDFPEEDIAPDTHAALTRRFQAALGTLDALLRTAREGQLLRHGLRAAIIGRPNAGKSSLLNQLLGRDRAIVSPMPGTTRDTIEETANIRGLPVVFIDTAGLRDAGDAVEAEGIRRSRESLQQAELILHVLDHAVPFEAWDELRHAEASGKKRLFVQNKMDLPGRLILPPDLPGPVLNVCCLTGQGIDALKDAIKQAIWSGAVRADRLEVAIGVRHQQALQQARTSLLQAANALETRLSPEFVAIDLRLAIDAVGEIVGKTTTEDLLDSVFRQFCLGK